MTRVSHDEWPEWPPDALEHLGACPVCGDSHRTVLYRNLVDRLFGAPGHWTMFSCGGCGSGYLDPRPSIETIGLVYANYETHRPAAAPSVAGDGRLASRLRNGYLDAKYGYDLHPASRVGYIAMHLLPPPLRLEWDHFARHLSKPKQGRNKLLDVGCGNGEFLLRARTQGWDVWGIDFDAEALVHAVKENIPAVQGAIEPERFAPSSFDAITSHQVIEHVHHPSRFLATLHDWLKPGGTVWIGTPNIDSDLRKEFGSDWYPLQAPGHLQVFSPGALLFAMRSAGFVDATIVPRGYNESHYHRVSTKLRRVGRNSSNASVTSAREASLPLLQRILLELNVWLQPARGSDLVAIARKPTS